MLCVSRSWYGYFWYNMFGIVKLDSRSESCINDATTFDARQRGWCSIQSRFRCGEKLEIKCTEASQETMASSENFVRGKDRFEITVKLKSKRFRISRKNNSSGLAFQLICHDFVI